MGAMSAGAALENPVFLRYLIFAGCLLGGAGLILLVLRFVFGKDVASVARTYRGWWIMAPLIFGAIFAGREATLIGVCLVACGGFKEFARATGLYRDWWMTGAVYLSIAALTGAALVTDPRLLVPGWYGLFMALPVYAICMILLIPILHDRVKGQLQTMALAILGFIYMGWMFGHLGFLVNSPSHAYGYVLFLIFAVELNDVAAFTFGKLFGKRKLRPEISPNKTWSGALGALGVSLALPWLLRFSFPHFGWQELVLTGLIVGIGGQLGDLTISVIKRDLGTKDMGAVIPGHGGLLDRVDSLIFTAPLFFHMARWFHGLG